MHALRKSDNESVLSKLDKVYSFICVALMHSQRKIDLSIKNRVIKTVIAWNFQNIGILFRYPHQAGPTNVSFAL
jgi:hypothetical protein